MKSFLMALTALPVLALAACEDILAPDISRKSVAVISPADGVEAPEGRVSFRWSAMAGAERYRLVVVSPNFEAARLVARDTVFVQDTLASIMGFGCDLTLAAADYRWSIQAFNHAYESRRSVYGLTVVPTPETPETPESEIPTSETREETEL